MLGLCTSRLALGLGAALAIGLSLGPAAPAVHAQQVRVTGRPGMGGMGFGDRITQSDIDRFGKILGLNATQSEAVKDLYQAYDAEYTAASKVMQDKFEKVQADFADTQDFTVWQKDWPEVVEKYQKKVSELEKSLMGDLKAMLTSEQAAKWPAAERAQRRAKSLNGMNMPGVSLAGDSVDLITMVDELKLSRTPDAVAQSLDRYESEIDQAVVERDAKRKEMADQMSGGFGRKKDDKSGGGGMPDFSKIGEMMQEMRKTGIKVRDINDRYASQIASSLPEAQREDFSTRYKKAKFPQIYREPYPLKALTAAKDFKDLTSEQRSTIDEILAKYQRELAPLNERYAKAQADAEKDGGGSDMATGWMRMMSGGDQDNDDSELSQARKARRKLDSDTLDKLKGLLTDEQKDRLPERENQMWGMPRGR